MKYLITLPWMPYPATDGGKQGSFNMLMELQNMIDITLIYPVFFKKQMACQYLLKNNYQRLKFTLLNIIKIKMASSRNTHYFSLTVL